MRTLGANYNLDGAQLMKAGLTNASFENSAGGWNRIAFASSVNYTTYKNAARAHDGVGFMEMNTAVAGGSVAQDVAISTSPGESYTYSVWLRSLAPGGAPVSGSLALYGMGGTQEKGNTDFTVGSQWTLVSVPLDVANSGHTQLRAEIYMGSTGVNYDVDGAQLMKAGLTNASFENSAGGWSKINLSGNVNYVAYKNAARAHDGAGFLEMNSSVLDGSVYQDVAVSTNPGESYTFSVWMRSPTGTPISGRLALYGMGGTLEGAGTDFTVGPEWTLVSAPLDVGQSGHTQLRAQIYMRTPGANYNLDGATFARGNAAPPPIVNPQVTTAAGIQTALSRPSASPSRPKHGKYATFHAHLTPPAAAGAGTARITFSRRVTVTAHKKVRGRTVHYKKTYYRAVTTKTMSGRASDGYLSYRYRPKYAGKWKISVSYSGTGYTNSGPVTTLFTVR
jgi:hypothetical protein